MILTEKKNKRVDSGMESQDFQIQASSKAFEILSSGLYNNRERAVLRELMCNAYDAHVAANKKSVPFEVQLPTTLEPTLTIKDYGTGLSEEEVYELYTTYFSSNKTDSNMFVGALGLGSKSPFSVADQFTIKSRYNSTETTYLCFISEEGIPQVSKVFENETEEQNGMTIQVSIDKDYISKFKDEYKSVVKPFAIEPRVTGIKDEDIVLYKNTETTLEGKGWKWVHKNGFSRDDLSVIQGNVEYPLVIENLNIDSGIKKFYNSLLRRYQDKILIYFPLGTLNVAANREELSLDDKTVKNIEKRLVIVRDEIKENAITKVNTIENDFEIASYYNTFGHSMREIIGGIEWKGVNVEEVLLGKRIEEKHKGKIIKFSPSNRGNGVSREECIYRMPVSGDMRVFYYDYDRGKNKGIPKIKNAIRTGQFKRAILVYDLSILQEQYYGTIQYTNLSEFEGPAVNTRNTSQNQNRIPEMKVFRSFNYGFYTNKDYYSENFYNMLNHSKKKVICIVSGGNKRVMVNGTAIHEDEITSIIHRMFKRYKPFYKHTYIPIMYKVSKPESRTEEFNTHPQIVKFDDVFEYMLHKETQNAIKPYVFSTLLSRLRGNNFSDFTHHFGNSIGLDTANIYDKNSPIVKLLNIYKLINENMVSSISERKRIGYQEDLIRIGRLLKYRKASEIENIRQSIKTDYVMKKINEVYKHYPLLRHVREYSFSTDSREELIKNLENYINLIDKN